ncbi:acyl-CoA thioesterase [Pedobacter immunditicola]|uniref:acyl-CoA thioesterase n=1 Tax=Pedobacter immunditicola TaxID=3133440 RepID=UPI0030A2FD8B
MIFKTFWRKKEKRPDKTAEVINHFDNYKYKTTIDTRFADFDMMGHANNSVYFTYLEIARTKYWHHAINWDWKKTGVVIANASLDYITPIFLEDKLIIYVRTSRIGKTSFDLEYLIVKLAGGKEVICSKGKTVCVAFDYAAKAAADIPIREREKMMAFEQLTETI